MSPFCQLEMTPTDRGFESLCGYWLVGIVDWPNRAGLPGVAQESPCFEYLERTSAPAGRPRSQLPLSGDVSDQLGLAHLPQQQLTAELGREAVAPCRLDQKPGAAALPALVMIAVRYSYALTQASAPMAK